MEGRSKPSIHCSRCSIGTRRQLAAEPECSGRGFEALPRYATNVSYATPRFRALMVANAAIGGLDARFRLLLKPGNSGGVEEGVYEQPRSQ
jgi:hypothetical protein